MVCFGVDGSDYDWSRGSFDVASMAADGICFLTHKATEAASIRHVHLAEALNRGRAAGIPVLGAYHVVRSAPSVQAQVAYFFAYLDSAVPWWRTWPGFVLQVDLEKWSYDPVTVAEAPRAMASGTDNVIWPMTETERHNAAGTGASFTAALRAAKPRTACVVVYASKNQYGDSLTGIGAPLWNANYPSGRAATYRALYPGDTGPGWAVYSGQAPAFWQYASTASVGLQPGCDVNAFRGTFAQLQALVGGSDMAGEADSAFVKPYTGTEPWISGSSWMARAVEMPLRTVNTSVGAVLTALAAAETRDVAAMAAIQALGAALNAGGGSVEVAAIVSAIQGAGAATNATVTALKAELDTAIAECADLKAKLKEALA